jgi:hypothetical protein
MGGTAKFVDYQPMMLLVGLLKICVIFYEKLEEEMS